ncbi:hypothetical protein KZ829_40985 [Actinoplanes hulinensis]|uniref:Uncharacterized protein n=1 Tax=Actinoplanes hulinensis TaxID=1144547 RepID=A0ABS7BGU6_9ACTN|nr:hypothetical protein [Actinoplanes hulinensis]MBW6440119.1 hypothetical protein [Actinoplanes hulinensis]
MKDLKKDLDDYEPPVFVPEPEVTKSAPAPVPSTPVYVAEPPSKLAPATVPLGKLAMPVFQPVAEQTARKQGTPPIPKLDVALFLAWRQVWTLKGLSRGRLLHSLSLAPQEEATIELYTWERHRKTLEQSSETGTEQTFEGTDSTKDTSDVYSEVNRQRDFQWQVSGSLRATYRPVAGEITLGADASVSNKSTIGEIGKTTQNRVHETVVKASTKVRSQRVTKISETVEWGSEQRITRKIRNPNLCHTLNLDYYEVLAHYAIETTFLPEDSRLCAFVPNPISTELTEAVVRRNETALSDALLEGSLRAGFEAIRYLEAYAIAVTEQAARRAAAAKVAQTGVKKPKPDPVVVSKEQSDLISAIRDLRTAALQFGARVDAHAALDAIALHENVSDGSRRNARRWLFRRLVEAKFSSFAAELMALKDRKDEDLTVDYARQLAGVLPMPQGSPTLASLGELSDKEKETYALSAAIRAGHMKDEWDWAWWSGRCREENMYTPEDMGVPGRVQRVMEKWQAYDAAPPATAAGDKAADDADQRQGQQAAEDVLEMKFPLEEIARHRERADALMSHLREHWSYYRFALFQALPPSEQLERLIIGSSNVLRAGMFEPRVVSAHGDQLAVPLNTSNYPGLEAFLLNMLGDVRNTEPATSTVLLPTPGMSIESRLGRCTGCEEYIELTRAIELRRLTAMAEQAELEAERLRAELGKT